MQVKDDDFRRLRAVEAMRADSILACQVYDALRDLVREKDNYGGVPDTSPAWNFARNTVDRVEARPQ